MKGLFRVSSLFILSLFILLLIGGVFVSAGGAMNCEEKRLIVLSVLTATLSGETEVETNKGTFSKPDCSGSPTNNLKYESTLKLADTPKTKTPVAYLNGAVASAGTSYTMATSNSASVKVKGENSSSTGSATFASLYEATGGSEAFWYDQAGVQIWSGTAAEFTRDNFNAGTFIVNATTVAAAEESGEESGAESGEEGGDDEGEDTCKADDDNCETQEECEANGYHWWDDRCNSGEKPLCDKDHLSRCETEGECNNAGSAFWDKTAKQCKPCLSECIEEKTDNPLNGVCCAIKCGPAPAAKITISAEDTCIENEEGNLDYYEFFCDGKSGNARREKNGLCNGFAELLFYDANGESVEKLLYNQEYNPKLIFDIIPEGVKYPIVYYGIDQEMTEEIYFSPCTIEKEGTMEYCSLDYDLTKKDMVGKMDARLEAISSKDGSYALISPDVFIDTKSLPRPKIKFKEI